MVRSELARLRGDFPRLGFLVIRHCWYAIQGRNRLLVCSGPHELRRALAPFLQGHATDTRHRPADS
ncbi:hypothetical protein AB0M95_38970 [Sphaerisporangium sp. NPDC051017]|uniref:hypothetical protein n=1 Tax=Sphaerisporangium sp. NPDC051017 TaxID=3154636 RepID=UPI00343F6FEC